jgi:hypothetical protein
MTCFCNNLHLGRRVSVITFICYHVHLVVPDEGYYRNTSYQIKVITETSRTRWRLSQKHVVPDESYHWNMWYQMKVTTETRGTPAFGTMCFCHNFHLVRRVSVTTFIWYDVFLLKPSSGTTCFCNNLHLVGRVSVITFIDEGYYRNTSYQVKVITGTRCTKLRLLQKHVVPDGGYHRNRSYQMKVMTEARRTRWRFLS